jgi:hypothetical protein
MKQCGLILVLAGLLALPAVAQVQGPRPNIGAGQGQQNPQRPNAPTPEQQQQNQLLASIENFYISGFRRDVELTDDQFIKINGFVQQFIRMRFRAAMGRENLSQRLDQLRSQPNPSVDDIANLTVEKALVDANYAKLEPDFLNKIRADIRSNQILLVLAFNEKFFEKQLPELIAQVRANQRGQQVRPNVNPNRPNVQNPRGEALRDRNQQNR